MNRIFSARFVVSAGRAGAWLTLAAALISAPARPVGAGPDDSSPTPLATFDSAIGAEMRTIRATAEHITDSPAVGAGCVKLTTEKPQRRVSYFIVPVPADYRLAGFAGLSAHLRTAGVADEPVRLRWYALDARNAAIFQRRFDLPADGQWHHLTWSFENWRWGDLLGAWGDVRAIGLRIESLVDAVFLDDMQLLPGERGDASALPADRWAENMAFGEAPVLSLETELVRVTAPEIEGISKADLQPIIDRAAGIPTFFRRVFGDAVRPIAGERKISMLIFRDGEQYRAFFERLGQFWDAQIAPPNAGGYAVQDLATSFHRDGETIDRPVFFHETVHAFAARLLRLMPGKQAHDWLQEGLANYLQLCLFPESLDRGAYVRHFAVPIDPNGRTFFKPLHTLLTGDVGLENYAQLASLTAFLVEEKTEWLPTIAKHLADGQSIADALAACGTDFSRLQADWWAWGQRTFAADSAPPAGPGTIFKVPEEWAVPESGNGDGAGDGDSGN